MKLRRIFILEKNDLEDVNDNNSVHINKRLDVSLTHLQRMIGIEKFQSFTFVIYKCT